VRFGAYHIYIPALLKPGPRALAAQLWALAHDGPQTKGLDDLLHLAGSGRTSIPVNREIDAVLYGTAGYRVSGERAVRVDILERLADLIRPALSWREGAPGTKPPGAIAGGGFTVVNGMTSLTGASGEDFASILRSLGYRMERRPKPAEPAPAAAPLETASPAESDPVVQTPAVEGEAAPHESAPEVSHAAVQEPLEAALQPAADLVTASSTALTEDTETAATPSSAVAEASAEIAPDKPAEEPVMIEVWRPGRAGRPEGARRPRFKRREAGRHKAAEQGTSRQPDAAVAAVAAAPTEASPPSAESAATEQPHAKRHQRHHRRPKPEQRFDRPPRERDRERPARPQRFERREREKAPDPNSPFAKLAALKAQLEADAKERR
jgi:ATP-dependent RNA helicase SUPV3L1/SUV3